MTIRSIQFLHGSAAGWGVGRRGACIYFLPAAGAGAGSGCCAAAATTFAQSLLSTAPYELTTTKPESASIDRPTPQRQQRARADDKPSNPRIPLIHILFSFFHFTPAPLSLWLPLPPLLPAPEQGGPALGQGVGKLVVDGLEPFGREMGPRLFYMCVEYERIGWVVGWSVG